MVRLIWQCELCNDIIVSCSTRHQINTCDCGCSVVDLEEGYSRVIGNVNYISLKELINGKWVKLQ